MDEKEQAFWMRVFLQEMQAHTADDFVPEDSTGFAARAADLAVKQLRIRPDAGCFSHTATTDGNPVIACKLCNAHVGTVVHMCPALADEEEEPADEA